MEMFLNTANPFVIMFYTLIVAGLIFVARRYENVVLLIVLIIANISFLIYHSVTLEKLEADQVEMISQVYHCIGFDLIMLLLIFISYLWVDNLNAKKKKIKSYDDGLDWFWNKL